MPHRWPSEPELVRWELNVVDRAFSVCGRRMHVCDHRCHPIDTLEGPRLLINRLPARRDCPDVLCAGHRHTVSPEAEVPARRDCRIRSSGGICFAGWAIVSRRVGIARHWSVPQIRAELRDTHQIGLSEDAIEDAVRDYQSRRAGVGRAPTRSPGAGARIRRRGPVAVDDRRVAAGERP